MQHSYEIFYEKLLLRQVCRSDIELLRLWRNDKIATKYLRSIGEITSQMQEEWFNLYLRNENELAMAIVERSDLNSLIGSISLYNFNGKEAEFGKIMIGDSRAHGKGFGRQSLVMMLKLGFEKLGLEKITAEVHTENIAAYTNYIRVGCYVVGKRPSCVGGFEYLLEIDKQTLKNNSSYYDDILIWENGHLC